MSMRWRVLHSRHSRTSATEAAGEDNVADAYRPGGTTPAVIDSGLGDGCNMAAAGGVERPVHDEKTNDSTD